MELKTNEKFKSLVPPLTVEEYSQLEKNIIEEGCRDALVVWPRLIEKETGLCKGQNCYKEVNLECGDGIWNCVECGYGVLPFEYEFVLVDGHNRYEICQKHGIEFKTTEFQYDFDNEEAVADWIDANQLGRRNLTPEQMRLIRGRRYNRTKKAPTGFADRNLSGGQNEQRESTADKLAKEYGVSNPTIRRDGQLYSQLEELKTTYPEEVERVYQGKARIKTVFDVKRADEKVGKPWTESELARKAEVENGKTITANIYKDIKLIEWAKKNDLYERIDRYTDWGNPFEIPGDGDRQEVCESYKIYYRLKKSLHPRVGELKGNVLGCHCYPEQCHGDFLKEVAENADR